MEKNILDMSYKLATHTNAMLAYWDSDLICRFANECYKDWFGYSPDQMVNKVNLPELLGPELFEKNHVYVANALSGQQQVFLRDLKTTQGDIKTVLATYTPDLSAGRVHGFFVHVADLSPVLNNRQPSASEFLERATNPSNLDQLVFDPADKATRLLQQCLFKGFPGVAWLAKECFVSESSLKRVFFNRHGQTPYVWFRDQQMKIAHDYISRKRLSKKQVANMLSFRNPSNFSLRYRQFVDRAGLNRALESLE